MHKETQNCIKTGSVEDQHVCMYKVVFCIYIVLLTNLLYQSKSSDLQPILYYLLQLIYSLYSLLNSVSLTMFQ